jgi:hypothetical protein
MFLSYKVKEISNLISYEYKDEMNESWIIS